MKPAAHFSLNLADSLVLKRIGGICTGAFFFLIAACIPFDLALAGLRGSAGWDRSEFRGARSGAGPFADEERDFDRAGLRERNKANSKSEIESDDRGNNDRANMSELRKKHKIQRDQRCNIANKTYSRIGNNDDRAAAHCEENITDQSPVSQK